MSAAPSNGTGTPIDAAARAARADRRRAARRAPSAARKRRMSPVCASATSTSPVLSIVTPPLGAVSALAAASRGAARAPRGQRAPRDHVPHERDAADGGARHDDVTRAACARCAAVAGPQPEARPRRGHARTDRHEAFGHAWRDRARDRRAPPRASSARRRAAGCTATASTDGAADRRPAQGDGRARRRHEQDGQRQRLHGAARSSGAAGCSTRSRQRPSACSSTSARTCSQPQRPTATLRSRSARQPSSTSTRPRRPGGAQHAGQLGEQGAVARPSARSRTSRCAEPPSEQQRRAHRVAQRRHRRLPRHARDVLGRHHRSGGDHIPRTRP